MMQSICGYAQNMSEPPHAIMIQYILKIESYDVLILRITSELFTGIFHKIGPVIHSPMILNLQPPGMIQLPNKRKLPTSLASANFGLQSIQSRKPIYTYKV